MFMKKKLLGIFFVLFASLSIWAQGAKPESLTVGEFFSNPLGMNLENMRFSWKLPEGRDVKQKAYRVQVSNSADNFDSALIWDSGKVESDQSVFIPFGREVPSGQKYYWRVKVWYADGDESEWSDINNFEAGLTKNSDWKAKWISTSEPINHQELDILRNNGKIDKVPRDSVQPTYLRKEFETSKDIKKARLYVASKGLFQAYVNGEKVGDDYWGTGWTDYGTRIQSNTYDVTKLLGDGANAVAAIVADGWYAGRIGWTHQKGLYGSVPQILLQLEIEYEDGSKEYLVSDETWKCSYGPIVSSDIYDGETYNANLEMEGWNTADFDDSSWKQAKAYPLDQKVLIEPRRSQPIRIIQDMRPISVNEVAPGKFVFDFGQNMVGWVSLNNIPMSMGQCVKIRFAEMLEKDGNLYTENYRDAKSTDYYISKGGKANWSPLFTYHGFRYVELSGFPEGTKPSIDWVIGRVMHNDMQPTGTFVCSSALVNKLQNCIIWGQKGNFFSTPTDCPQRNERLGWLGDAQVFIPTAAFNMNVDAFFNKWCVDVLDAQTPAGAYSHVAPDVLLNARENPCPAWASAGVICPWEIYQAFGDLKILARNYEGMKKWVEFQKSHTKNLVYGEVGHGDWLQPGAFPISDCPKSLIGTAYFVRTTDIVAKVADILGKKDDAERFRKLASEIRAAFNAAFVKEDGTIKSDCQTAYLLPLAFEILPKEMEKKSFAKLLEALKRDKMHLNTGFLGTPLLNPVLTKFGRMDLAYQLLNNQTYPSWLYPVLQGGTTMWERWNSYSHKDGFGDASMNSFNHYAYGAIGQWLYKDVAGLWYNPDKPGYKSVLFAPKPGGGITFASATHETPYGTARSVWKTSNGVMEWTVTIPSNSEGKLVFPTDKENSIRIDGNPLEKGSLKKAACGRPTITLPSGTYQILLKL